MPIRFDDIGNRLKAFRLGSDLSAEDIAAKLGISRTALYRFEKGEVAKIETLEKLAELLQVSVPTLLGVGVEYAMWDHWTGKAEYMWLDSKSGYNACGADSILGQTFCWAQSPSPVNLIKIGMNYKF